MRQGCRMESHNLHQGSDLALKLLFSHPIMMESLIKGFVSQAWSKDLNFSKLRKVNVKHTTDDFRTRENDLIWQIEFKGQPLYIVCLLEFQSTIDRFMAVRILTYIGLIYQDLLRNKKVTLVEKDKLPPVFSLVFYTGSQKWNAPTKLKECLSSAIPASLVKYQPHIEYMLLDVGQIDLKEYTFDEDNIVSCLVELENVGKLTNQKVIIDKLIAKLQGPEFDSLRRAFLVYINKIWKPRKRFKCEEFIDLGEVSVMLSEKIDQWEKEKIEQGLQQGLQQGADNERRTISLKLLDHKFPQAPLAIKAKVQQLPKHSLEAFLDKIIQAEEVEELLD